MAVFGSAQERHDHFGPYMEKLVNDPVVGPKFVAANTSFRVNCTDPDAVMVLDATSAPATHKIGDEAKAADAEVELSMSSDDGHTFWLGDLDPPIAQARKKVRIQGPIPKLPGMLPAITPAFVRYREYVQDHPVGSPS